MPQGLKGWLSWGAAQLILTLIFRWLYKLAENAVLGWGDDQIAALFGLKSPAASTVFAWLPPLLLAALVLWIYHLVHAGFVATRHGFSSRRDVWAERDQLELSAIACLSVGKDI